MPYTPPSQRSPAASAPHSPNVSRRSSYQTPFGPAVSNRPELPRSTSYLTRHRRTTSVKNTLYDSNQPTPPRTADTDKDFGDKHGLNASGSLRQSPPPVTDECHIPAGAVISPPDSTQNSSDEDDSKDDSRGRQLENLAELQAAIRVIEQHRSSSPTRIEGDLAKASQALSLVVPPENGDKPTVDHVEEGTVQVLRRIAHSSSRSEPAAFLIQPYSPETPTTGSDEECLTDEDEPERSRRKPPMVRKKSGELVRPALRPSSAKRRPSSMPGTPTFSKAVHFDSHLEHVRHFLQVDRPLAVSAGSSPVDAYESDTEFPFGADISVGRTPPFEWEIVVSNFPPETPIRLSLPVRVERVFLSSDNKNLVGSVAVANLAFNKHVTARFTLDYWKTTSEVVAEYNHDLRQPKRDGYDRFNFNIKLADQANLEAKTMFFCVKYCVNGQEYWDNNNSTNFQVDFRKKAKPVNGKKGLQGAASRPANALPRSHKKSPAPRPKSMPVSFDDFADGFDSKYRFDDFKQPVTDYLGESGTSVRLKGVKSAVSLGSDNLTRRAPQPHGQAFGNRYDFGASLSAAIQAANSAMGDKSSVTMKPKAKKQNRPPMFTIDPDEVTTPLAVSNNQSRASTQGSKPIASPSKSTAAENPRPTGAEKPVLASQSYNELLDKYCFFGSVKSSPQLKDGTLPSDQYDGNNDEGYTVDSSDSTADSSPLMMEKQSPPRSQKASIQSSRSASPAPMTGFPAGTSSVYQNLHIGFPFQHETHTATAIRS